MTTPNHPLRDRLALVTGASAGIGYDTALHLGSLGAKLILNARRESRLIELAQRLNDQYPTEDDTPRAAVVAGDAADDPIIDQMLAAAEHFGKQTPDIVVVNAGRGLAGSVLTSDESQWEEMVRTNLLGASKLIRRAGNALATLQSSRDWPAGGPADLVVLGSTVGRHISPFSSMYGATKFAVNSLAEAARRELGPKGVRVTLIEPGIVESEFQGVAGYDQKSFGDLMSRVSPVLTPTDIARSIAFVCTQPPGVHCSDIVIRPTRQDYP